MSSEDDVSGHEQGDRNEGGTDATGVTRRRAMSLAGAAGLGLSMPGLVRGSRGDAGSAGQEARTIENVNDIVASREPVGDYFSLKTSGSEDGNVQLYDETAKTWFMRATESGVENEPGPVKFQSPIRGAPASDPGVQQPGSLDVRGGVSLENPSIEGWNVVDVVEAGGDPTGEEPIEDVLAENLGPKTVFAFPSGTYRLTEALQASSFESIAFVGKPEATIDVANSLEHAALSLRGAPSDTADEGICIDDRDGGQPAGKIFVDSLTIDIGGVNAPALAAHAGEYMDVRNVDVVGKRTWAGTADPTTETVTLSVRDPHGVGRVEVRLPDGGEFAEKASQADEFIGIRTYPDRHEGVLHLVNCVVQGFPNNGFYLKRHDSADRLDASGEVHVQNCVARNNGLANIRLGEGDTARNCRVEIDVDCKPYASALACYAEHGPALFDGIYVHRESGVNNLLRGSNTGSEVTFRNMTVHDEGAGHVLAVENACNMTIADSTIVNSGGDYYSGTFNSGRLTLENVYWRSKGSSNNRRGLVVAPDGSVEFLTVKDCTFDVDHTALRINGTRARVVGNRFKSGQLTWDSPEDAPVSGRIRDNEFSADGGYNEITAGDDHVVADNWGL
ncbi:hypothetical protein ACFQMA_14475 [Halosimplex aquaticum]|uniref:Right handed beta helix region n=1 Tax=Halosimplex aquaticum TaxID=3026162 RepID=A0ABD5Y0U5_9EURY|nr:hypothetical protein [Halosimplex aquaticum]